MNFQRLTRAINGRHINVRFNVRRIDAWDFLALNLKIIGRPS
jgi:hypothetical protein